ncbi:SEL1 domain containing protein RGD735029, isoform CRA_d [Rattus norvegicus]|uniref:DAP3-binding cell death enhancer 1 n=1 Tax=Rattus norvegicus TaxID=10116 RepID=DELE1_RAT|nr:RecName: Full=DAP3-binding cell death enhancer 1; AltName: Full=DAP3-binding cell death enhancer 1, long form; Short=DELE1(L); AltName: Full=Death ligand signal enhancer; Contains: RecName: Full=DAP3-binding cell death enhancer 1 short form; Short=DELE1(S); Short=S-DELE1; Flags: Precursor [Rattus norvegicus]EDL76436.1 SEL1 domain containing protein RGD735029, isoform CRA_d [Rattus norvegicus]
MWRLTGILGRALPRLLGPGFRGITPKPTSSDGPQTTSTTLPLPRVNFDRSGSHGSKRNRDPKCCGWKEAFHWMSAHVSPNTLRDAVSWGTLAVLALHLARQIHFHAPLVAGPQSAERCSWHSPLYRFLSSSWWHPHSSLRRHVLPSPDCPAPRNTGLREPRLGQEEPAARSQGLPSDSSLKPGLLNLPEEEPSDFGFLNASRDFTSQAKAAEAGPPGGKNEQDKPKALPLEEAVTSIQQLFQLSVAIAFNFLGTENIKTGDYTAAFSYFQKAADRGYSKAQYNVGLCLEHGRGTPRDLSKAVLFYHLAAVQGHSLAQYRYARCLLQSPGSMSDPERQRAVSLLKQAADSGLTEAQAFLGVLFTKEPHLDEQKAVKYFWLAASNGDSQSRFHLGICYEKGLGVQRNLGEAVKCYQKSAAMGNEPAQERLRTLFNVEAAGPSHLAIGLKSFSSPSLCSLNTFLAGASGLPHASSTGNLGLLCRSGHLGTSHGAPSRAMPSLERSLVRLGFG